MNGTKLPDISTAQTEFELFFFFFLSLLGLLQRATRMHHQTLEGFYCMVFSMACVMLAGHKAVACIRARTGTEDVGSPCDAGPPRDAGPPCLVHRIT